MFHRAEPDEAGFGVMTSTPGLTRSSHVLMLSGLPSRTTNTTTDEVTMPLVVVLVPVLGDLAVVDQAGHVGLEREVHEVGLLAALDGAALVTRGAVRRLEGDALAVVGLLEGLEDVFVGALEDGEADHVDGLLLLAGAAGESKSSREGCHSRDLELLSHLPLPSASPRRHLLRMSSNLLDLIRKHGIDTTWSTSRRCRRPQGRTRLVWRARRLRW